jgi:hypothetical protein
MASLLGISLFALDQGWIIGSHVQLFHLASGALTRYDTGAACDPLAT